MKNASQAVNTRKSQWFTKYRTGSAFAPLRPAMFALTIGMAIAVSSTRADASCQEACLPNQSTAFGESALVSGPTSSGNTAVGYEALFNTTANDNTGIGKLSMFGNTTGVANTALGSSSLQFNISGSNNTATGQSALANNTSGNLNTASGVAALGNNSTGSNNCAIGFEALADGQTGHDNVAMGYLCLRAVTSGGSNVALGSSAGINVTTGSNNIEFSNAGTSGDNGVIRIGTSGVQTSTFVAGIRGVVVGGGQPVAVSASGQLGIKGSSARFKDAIKPMGNASEAILSLHPVSFRYKKELDPSNSPQFGLVAEEVAKSSPDLVVMDEAGKPFTVRYEEVNAMLLNEFLKEHQKVAAQDSVITDLRSTVAREEKQVASLIATVKAQEAEIRSVAALVRSGDRQGQLVSNSQ